MLATKPTRSYNDFISLVYLNIIIARIDLWRIFLLKINKFKKNLHLFPQVEAERRFLKPIGRHEAERWSLKRIGRHEWGGECKRELFASQKNTQRLGLWITSYRFLLYLGYVDTPRRNTCVLSCATITTTYTFHFKILYEVKYIVPPLACCLLF